MVSSLKDLLPCLHKGVAGLGLGQSKLNSSRLSRSEEERFSNKDILFGTVHEKLALTSASHTADSSVFLLSSAALFCQAGI